jgi:hypothetical protein
LGSHEIRRSGATNQQWLVREIDGSWQTGGVSIILQVFFPGIRTLLHTLRKHRDRRRFVPRALMNTMYDQKRLPSREIPAATLGMGGNL